MNPDRPTDPREQMEVRITALLLGEASAFEEAELLEAVKNDPALAAYYDEMLGTVKQMTEATQLAPFNDSVTPPKLSETRRSGLEALFKQPATKTVELDSAKERRQHTGWSQHLVAIAAALVILFVAAGFLLPALSKAKGKARFVRLDQDSRNQLIDQLSVATDAGLLSSSIDGDQGGAARSVNGPLNGYSIQPAPESSSSSDEVVVELDERFLARYGSSRADSAQKARRPAVIPAPPVTEPAVAVRKPIAIYLPSAAPAESAGAPVQVASDSLRRRVDPVSSPERYYFRHPQDNRLAAFADSAAAPMTVETPAQAPEPRPELLALGSIAPAPAGDVAAAKKLATKPAPAAGGGDVQFAPLLIVGSQMPTSEVESRGRRLQIAEAKDASFDGAARQSAGVSDSQPLLAGINGAQGQAGGGAVVTGQPVVPANAPTTADQAFGYFDVPATGAPVAAFGNQVHAANTWHADFGAMATEPAVESFGRGVVADDFAINDQVASDLFAKQQADTKSVERLDRIETSLGLPFKAAKIPAEPMYEERVLREQRQLNRERVKELVDQLAVRGESGGRVEVELKRKADGADSPTVFAQESLANGIRFLTTTNDMSHVNKAIGDYLKAEGVELSGASTYFYNDRKGTLFVRAPAEEMEKVERAMDRLTRGEASLAGTTTQSRFDTLADLSSAEFAMASDNGRARQIQQQIESDLVAAPEVTKLIEEVVESQPATPPPPSLEPLPEIRTVDNAFSTFSLNVSDVSFQLAASSLENGQMPDGARLRSEEFINAFDYRDPMPAPGQRVAFNWERARNPFAHNRELLRFSVQTAAAGREPGRPLNLVLLLDNSGSMERADRVQITGQMLRVLAAGLNDYDRISVISFARTPRLIVDGLPGGDHRTLLDQMTGLNPDGGTNLEDALKLAYETAAKHFQTGGNNRVILITDGAANLGNVDPSQLRERVIEQRRKGIALDCFGVGWEGYNDNLLEQLSRNGDGRYGFLNDADNAVFEFSRQLAGALQVAAADVKAQVEFNPNRVTVYRQIGYQQHQLTKEQFRDNTVDAAEIGAAEAGNALYSVEVNPNGNGPIGTFRVRYRVPSTGLYEEKEWVLDYAPKAAELEQAGPAMRLTSTAAAFAEWLANSPHAQSVTPDALQNLLRDVPEAYSPDPRPAKLRAMIQRARAISGR